MPFLEKSNLKTNKRFFIRVKYLKYIVLLLFVTANSFAAVWHVPDSIATIQSAIDTASSGDTVLVKNPYQNLGPVEIAEKKISLLSRSYISNPSSYNIANGAAIYDTVNTRPLLKIINSDSTVVRGFLLDKSDAGEGGGVIVENSRGVIFEGLYFKGNTLAVSGSELMIEKTLHYQLSDTAAVLLSVNNASVNIINSIWKNSSVLNLIEAQSNAELHIANLAVFDNNCSGRLYNILSSIAYFDFTTSYKNSFGLQPWLVSSSFVNIENSVLQHSPPVDISQFDINYCAVPGDFPGQGNISIDPLVDTTGATPVLLNTSPCISAADPDTTGIPRKDLLGNIRPNPEWAPPDMGAFESERHMMLNESHRLIVSPLGNDVWGNGSTEAPFRSIQVAADYAQDQDTIILSPGEYREAVEIVNKSLLISSPYLFTQDLAYLDSVVLTIDTNLTSSVLTLRDIDSLKLYGVSLQNGTGRYCYVNYSFGGGIYCENSELYLEHVKFTDNSANYCGGAIYALNSLVKMNNVSFDNNTAYFGGAIGLSSSTAHISDLIVENNTASSGGGVYLENGSKLIAYYASFNNNTARNDALASTLLKPSAISQYGGGFYAVNSDIRLHNTLIAGNRSMNKGAGIAMRAGKLHLVQSSLINNDASSDSAGVIYLIDSNDPAIIINSILWDPDETELIAENSDVNIISSAFNDGEGGILQIGNNNIDVQNIYSSNPVLADDGTLLSGSPYYNLGLTSYILDDKYLFNYLATDYSDSAPDLGFTGAHPEPAFVLPLVQTNIADTPEQYDLLSIYPNPFNPITHIDFNISNPGLTRLGIYDLSGRHITDLIDRLLIPGKYSTVFNAVDLPSGLYIALLEQGGLRLSTQKLLLVK